MCQLFFENKLFQVPALKHVELIVLSRALLEWPRLWNLPLCFLKDFSYYFLAWATFLLLQGDDRLWPALISSRNPSLYALQKIEYNFVVQMSSLPSPVCLACHQEGRDNKLPPSDVGQAWVRWEWLFGWQAGENSFGSRSQSFLTLHREELESLKWLLATYLVKLLGISKFTPAAA